MDLQTLRDTNVARCARWHEGFPEHTGPPYSEWLISDWSNAMGGECGEAQNVVKKIRRLDTGTRGRAAEADRAALVEKLADEIADTILYADLLAAKEGIDLSAAIVRKFNATSEEYELPERLS